LRSDCNIASQMIIARNNYTKHLIQLAEAFPVVAITDPRQAGKTTIAKLVFVGFDYIPITIQNFVFLKTS